MLGWFFGRRRGLDIGHVHGRADGLSDAVEIWEREMQKEFPARHLPNRLPEVLARQPLRVVKGGEP